MIPAAAMVRCRIAPTVERRILVSLGVLCLGAATAAGVRAQEDLSDWRLREILAFEESASAPLSGITGLRARADGGAYVSDARTPSILLVDAEGRFVRTIGREGEGPGEFRRIFRFGVRDDTLWVVDSGTRRITLFDPEGELAGTLGPGPWGHVPGYRLLVPLAWAGGESALVVGEEDSSPHSLRILRVSGEGVRALPVTVRTANRWLVVPTPGDPPGGSSEHQPFGHYDMLGVSPDGRLVWRVIRSPEPGNGRGSLELRGLDETGTERRLDVPYRLRPLTREHVDAWWNEWKSRGIASIWLERGVFPSEAALRDAAVNALERPPYLPPVSNAGGAIEDRGVLITAEYIFLEEWRQEREAEARWRVIDPERGHVAWLTVPAGCRLLDLAGDRAWCVRRDAFDIPTIVKLEVARP